MAHPSKRKGAMAERQAAVLLSELLGTTVKRELGEGRNEDVGDLHGVPDCTVQVKWCPANYADAMNGGLKQLAAQQNNRGTRFGALFLRIKGGEFRVVMTPEQYAALLLAATSR